MPKGVYQWPSMFALTGPLHVQSLSVAAQSPIMQKQAAGSSKLSDLFSHKNTCKGN